MNPSREGREARPKILRPVDPADPPPDTELEADDREGFSLRLTTGSSGALLTVQQPAGDKFYLRLALAEGVPAAISTIASRYRQGNERIESRAEDPAYLTTRRQVPPKHDTSPAEKVNALLRWQEIIDTVEALQSPSPDHRMDDVRTKLVDRVELVVERDFGRLREQLRNQSDGQKTVRMLLESRDETLIDLALRLIALEPGLADSVHEPLTDVYKDPSLRTDTRSRAWSRLHPTRRRAAAQYLEPQYVESPHDEPSDD